MPKHEPASPDGISGQSRDFPAEQRDTEAAIRLWHRRATEVGGPPPLSTFDFSRLTSDWGYRFLISGDEFVKASVFLVYGVHFARLLGLPEQPRSKIPLVHQLPVRYRPLFVDGYGEALRDLAPARLSGTVVHQRKLELYRAAFMPIRGANSVRSLIFGSFNYRVLPQQAASDGLRSDKHDSHPGIAITWNEVTR
jgi:hypothetical protein